MSNAKEYLQKIRLYDSRINNSMEELSDLEDMVTRVTPVLRGDVVSPSGNQDKLGDAVAKICDLKDKINRDIDTYINLKEEVIEKLKRITRPEYYNVLFKRYVEFKKWEEIALEMNYSFRNVTKLNGRALQAFSKILKEDEKE